MQIREHLEQLVESALQAAIDDHTLELDEVPEAALERPRDLSNGDWASTVALRSAKLARKAPRDIAQAIVDHLPENDHIASVDIAGPGFINIKLTPTAYQGVVSEAREQGADFGKSTVEGPNYINIEYVSANPTGPFHVGHGRWAALGDATARVLRHAGYRVYEENYINDHGVQMDNFGESVAVRYQQLLGRDVSMPESCYAGGYVKDIAQAIIDEDGDKWLDADPDERRLNFRERAYAFELSEQHRILDEFGTTFDMWFSERTLYVKDEHGKSQVDYAIEAMREKGYIYEQDGAIWFKSTEFGALEPDGPILFVDVALLAHGLDRVIDLALAMLVLHVERALGEPHVEGGAKLVEDAVLFGELEGVGAFAEVQAALVGVGVEPLVAVFVDDGLGDVLHVAAGVAGFGHGHVAAEQLLVAYRHGFAEVVHLNAVVVDVVLFIHAIAGVTKDARRGVAQCGPTAMAHMEGTRGVGGHVLDIDVIGALDRALAEIGTLFAGFRDDALIGGRSQLDVDEAGAGDVDRGDMVVFRQVVDDGLGDVARGLAGQLGRAQGHGRRPVAVGKIARTLQGSFRYFVQLERMIVDGGLKGALDELFQMFANLHDG